MKNKQQKTNSVTAAMHVVSPEALGLQGYEAAHGVERCVAQYIRVLRQNWRQGTVACKGRSDVARTNKKPFKQKGTGNARAGSARSPLWRGGGVAFGPQPRVRTLSMPQSMRHIALRYLLHTALAEGRVRTLAYDAAQSEKPSTASLAHFLREAGILGKKIVLLTSRDDVYLHASCANLAQVRLYLFDQVNAYTLADADYVVYCQKDEQYLKEMVHAWI